MFDFVEDYFTIENTFDYILSIQVSLNGFSFCITHPKEKSVVAFKSIPLKISSKTLLTRRFNDWYYSENILQKHFQKTRLIVFSNKFTLVPRAFQQNQLNEEISYLLFKDGEKLNMAENLIEPLNAKLLFSLPDDFQQRVSDSLGDCEIIHPIKLMTKSHNNSQHENAVKLLFSDNDLYVLITKNNEVVLSNVFTINHSNDAIYYLLSTLKQLDVNAKENTLLYGGKSVFAEESIKNISKYFASSEKQAPHNTTVTEKLNDTQIQENITLFL